MDRPGILTDLHFRLVWEAASDAMAISDSAGIVLAVNPAYCALYGYAAEDLVGHSFAVIFPLEARAWAEEQYRSVFQRPDLAPAFESLIQRSDGVRRTVESRYTFLEEQGRRVAMLSIIRDISDRKRAEAALTEVAQLEGATMMARDVADRLNNALAVAYGHLDLLAETAGLPEEQQGHVAGALSALETIAQSVRAYRRIVRVRSRSTPMGPAIDLEQSIAAGAAGTDPASASG